MGSKLLCGLISGLLLLAPALFGQSPSGKPVESATAQGKAVTPATAVMEHLAQEQRRVTAAAMQASLDKQRSAVNAAQGKQAPKPAGQQKTSDPAQNDFFMLPAPISPQERIAIVSAPVNRIADVTCDPASKAEIDPLVHAAAQREELDPNLLVAVIEQESGYRPCAVSAKGALGIMQIMPGTGDEFDLKDPFDPRQNIDAGAKYLKQLLTRYGDLSKALAAYNAGPTKVDDAQGVPPLAETTSYVSEILQKLRAVAPPSTPNPAAAPPAPNSIAAPSASNPIVAPVSPQNATPAAPNPIIAPASPQNGAPANPNR